MATSCSSLCRQDGTGASSLQARFSCLFPRISVLWLLLLAMAVTVGCGPSAGDVPQGDAASKPDEPPAKTANDAPRNAKIPFFHKPAKAPRAPRPDDWFEDITKTAGVDFTYRDGQEAGFYQLLENLGGCVGMLDYDKDGDIDLFFTGGGKITGPPLEVHGLPSVFYRNDGDLRFTDVTDEVGVRGGSYYSHGSTVGDFDRDGWLDIFVAGFHGCTLYRNNQKGGFVDVTESSGLRTDRWCVILNSKE